MNQRIQELAEESYNEFYNIHIDLEKFARLIVRECASRVDHILRERQAGGGTMGNDIREHFGVN